MPRPILIFDFDGTVALGDGPVRAYARAVATEAGLSPSFVDEIATGLADGDDAIDAYDLVRVRALAAGAAPDSQAVAGPYFRCTPYFRAPTGPHDWLNRTVIVGIGIRMPKLRESDPPDHSLFRYFAIR